MDRENKGILRPVKKHARLKSQSLRHAISPAHESFVFVLRERVSSFILLPSVLALWRNRTYAQMLLGRGLVQRLQ